MHVYSLSFFFFYHFVELFFFLNRVICFIDLPNSLKKQHENELWIIILPENNYVIFSGSPQAFHKSYE